MRSFPSITLVAGLLTLASSTFAGTPQDTNFTETIFATDSGLTDASGMAWATDGSNTLFVALKGGHVKVVRNGTVQVADFATLSPVYTNSECGTVGICVDPNYASNGYVYVFNTESSSLQRIYRYTAGMSGSDLIGSSKMQLGPDLPTAGQNHDGGAIAIGPDGYLYWGVGNLGNTSGPQVGNPPAGHGTGIDGGPDEHTSFASKICRMNRTNGAAVAGGPFSSWGTTVGDYAFAKGARNPFGLLFNPTNNSLWLTAVGDGYEQIFLVPSGGDIGWPTENNTSTTNGLLIPKLAYQRNDGVHPWTNGGGCITRGIFYSGTQYPSPYQGNLFWCEYNSGKVIRSVLNGAGDAVTGTSEFVSGATGVVDISVGYDGALYYVCRGSSNVYRLAYTGPTQSIVLTTSSLTITEGSSGTFGVHLALQPASTVTVNVARSSGNTNLSASPATLNFTTSNWGTDQTVTVSSVATPDGVNDTATITCSSSGLTSKNVQVTATDTGVSGAPTAHLVAPVDGQVVTGASADFYGTATVVSPATLAKAEFYIDDILKYTDPYNPGVGHFHFGGDHTMWNTTLTPDGFHVLRMTVYDSLNRTGSDQVTVYIANSTAVYQQDSASDGVVSIESEEYSAKVDASDGHAWVPDTSFAGTSGSSAMRAMPDTGTNYTGPGGYATVSPRLDFVVNFAKTGTHYVWVRGIGPSGAGSDDSCHVGLDGVETSTAERISSFGTTWTWSNTTMNPSQATINVGTTGPHVVNVWMREDGFAFDKLLLTTNAAYAAPAGSGPSQSPNIGGAPGGPFAGSASSSGGGKKKCGAIGIEALLLTAIFVRRRRRR